MSPDRARRRVGDAPRPDIPPLRRPHDYILAALKGMAVVTGAVAVVAAVGWLLAYVVSLAF